jgi:hypothetical protein
VLCGWTVQPSADTGERYRNAQRHRHLELAPRFGNLRVYQAAACLGEASFLHPRQGFEDGSPLQQVRSSDKRSLIVGPHGYAALTEALQQAPGGNAEPFEAIVEDQAGGADLA